MKLGIMQPYLFPYIGYFQLMGQVDEFIVYDNIEFTKKGWINRNRILVNGADSLISFPLKKDSDYLNVKERFLADTWTKDRRDLLNKIEGAYKKAPLFGIGFPLVEEILSFHDLNLFQFIFNSLVKLNEYLGIKTKLVISSTVPIDHSLKSQDKVIALCSSRNASVYINPIGGLELYDPAKFREHGLDLKFIKTTNVVYKQFDKPFVPMLSIIDVIMFNPVSEISKFLSSGFEFAEKPDV